MKKIFIICVLVLSTCATLFATPYTQKVEEICIKYYCYAKYGYNRGLSSEDAFVIAMFGAETAAKMQLANYIMQTNASVGVEWSENMERELKNARSLMNDEDRYNEYLASQQGRLTSLIKSKFKEKYTKDQFETLDQYRNRVQENAKISFDSICEVVMADLISSASFAIKPISYNAETGKYNVKFIEKYVIDTKEFTNEHMTSFSMKSEEARNFKEITITPEDVVSIDLVTINNDIHAQKIIFQDEMGIETTFSVGLKDVNPITFKYDDFKEAYPLIPGYTWSMSKMKDYYEDYAAIIRNTLSQYNLELKNNPYYTLETGAQFLLSYNNYKLSKTNRYSRAKLEDDVDVLNNNIKLDYEENITKMQNALRQNNPQKFIEIYTSGNSDFEYKIKQLMEEYKCYDYSYNDFAFFIIDNRSVPGATCYYKYIDLFNDDVEFNSYYDEKDKFMAKVKEREKLRVVYIRVLTKAQMQGDVKFNFKGAKNAKDQEINHIYVEPFLQIKEVEKWRNDVFKQFLRLDPKMAKEYTKVGSLFENNGEFFEAYVSNDYKKILKSKK